MSSIYPALYCIGGCAIIQIILILSALYAYQVNASKAPGDPKKRAYSPYAPWLAPITLPLLAIVNITIFVFVSLIFGVFLVIFPFTLIFFRLRFLIEWISKQALKIGNWVLKINTGLLRAAGFHPTSVELLYK